MHRIGTGRRAEAAHAAHRIRDIIYPNTAYHFEYSTSKGVAG